MTAGLAIWLLLFGGFGSWAALAPLDSAALAPGVVKADSNRKTVQHLDGGIVAELLVREGDRVRARTSAGAARCRGLGADRDALTAQDVSLLAREARLVAQATASDEIDFPGTLRERKSDPAVAAMISGQQKIFADQESALTSQVDVWRSRKLQLFAQISVHSGADRLARGQRALSARS